MRLGIGSAGHHLLPWSALVIAYGIGRMLPQRYRSALHQGRARLDQGLIVGESTEEFPWMWTTATTGRSYPLAERAIPCQPADHQLRECPIPK